MLLPSEKVTVHSESIPNGWRYVVSIDGMPKTVWGTMQDAVYARHRYMERLIKTVDICSESV